MSSWAVWWRARVEVWRAVGQPQFSAPEEGSAHRRRGGGGQKAVRGTVLRRYAHGRGLIIRMTRKELDEFSFEGAAAAAAVDTLWQHRVEFAQ